MSKASDADGARPDLDKFEGWDRTFAQMWEMCFRPEIERRLAAGQLTEPVKLYIAQALFRPKARTRLTREGRITEEGLKQVRRRRQTDAGITLTAAAKTWRCLPLYWLRSRWSRRQRRCLQSSARRIASRSLSEFTI